MYEARQIVFYDPLVESGRHRSDFFLDIRFGLGDVH